jgi:hypothetical protein
VGSFLVIGLQRFVRYPGSQARLRDAARFRARSTSHTVAVRYGYTNITLAVGWAQKDENLCLKTASQATASFGSSTWIRQD